MYRKLFLSQSSDSLIITVNQRLAHFLQSSEWNRSQPVRIETFDSWLGRLWIEELASHYPSEYLLNEAELSYLWQTVISTSLNDYPLLQVNSTAQLALQAWQNLKLWKKPLSELEASHGVEVEQFVNWAMAFEELCKEQGLICFLDLGLKLIELSEQLKLPSQISLVGFDELPPLYEYLLQTLNTQTNYYQVEQHPGNPLRITLSTHHEEILLMARWAKAYLNSQPNAQIACIVPELNNLRSSIKRIFDEVFEDSQLNFNISAGQALIQFNLIQIALNVLSIKQHKNSWEQLSEILCSSYLNSTLENQCIAAECDRILRERATDYLVALSTINQILAELKADYPNSDFYERWDKWQSELSHSPNQAFASDWSNCFKKELQLIGWLQNRRLNTEEEALFKQWEKMLAELSKFDHLIGSMSRSTAIAILKKMSQTTIFQARSQSSNLQILGLLEASGLAFDALWVMGLNDRNWPPAANPNPFIPYFQQKEWKMPHASTERELAYCLLIQQRLLSSAKSIILSYASEENHLKQGASSLIKGFPEISITELSDQFAIPPYLSKAQQLFQAHQLEFITDNQAPFITEEEPIQGGSYILKEQAICPFRAFAHIRLNAFSLNEPEIGISRLTKGMLAHKALELFWKKVKGQVELHQLSQNELNNEIAKCVDKALSSHEKTPFLKIERQRLIQILQEWLDFEKQRRSFKVIAQEAAYQIAIGNLNLKLRIDRIDQLEDGSYLIIDYKTGLPNISTWFEERMIDPQLPLYATYAFTETESLAFAQLQKGQMKLKGISAHETGQDGLIPLEKCRYPFDGNEWSELRTQWQHNLNKTANEFYAGKADVDPHKPAVACQQCDLQGLCRINEVME